LKRGAPLLADAHLEDDSMSLDFDGLKRADGASKLGEHHYLPILHQQIDLRSGHPPATPLLAASPAERRKRCSHTRASFISGTESSAKQFKARSANPTHHVAARGAWSPSAHHPPPSTRKSW
jgi:hypothetical protein